MHVAVAVLWKAMLKQLLIYLPYELVETVLLHAYISVQHETPDQEPVNEHDSDKESASENDGDDDEDS